MLRPTPSTRWQLARSFVFILVAFSISAALPFVVSAGRRATTRELIVRAPQTASEFLAPDAHVAVAVADIAVRLVSGRGSLY